MYVCTPKQSPYQISYWSNSYKKWHWEATNGTASILNLIKVFITFRDLNENSGTLRYEKLIGSKTLRNKKNVCKSYLKECHLRKKTKYLQIPLITRHTFWRVIKTGEKKILPRLKNGRKRH